MSNEFKNLTATGQKNTRLNSIIIAAVLIGIGTVLRMFAPPIAGMTPNFIISMYCLAIILVRPKASGALAIGIVSGVISMIFSKSPIPYFNLVTEPAGALVCYALVRGLPDTNLFKYFMKPVLGTSLGTLASGTLFVSLNKLFLHLPMKVAIGAFITVVLPTMVVNTVIAYVVYLPAHKALKLQSVAEEAA